MNNCDFVDIINTKIRDEVVRIVEKDLCELPNNKFKILNELLEWYDEKDDDERQIITKLIGRVYDCAAWRILHMLDDEKEYHGRFELCFIDDKTNEKTQFIDPPNLDELHELYEPEFLKNIR